MLIDVHGHYGYMFFPMQPSNEDSIVEIMDRYSMDLVIVSNLRGIFYNYERDCDEMFDAITKYPGKIKGYIVLNPNYPQRSASLLQKYSSHPQFAGVKLHPSWHDTPIDSPSYDPYFRICSEENIPMLIHSYVMDPRADHVSAPERIALMAKKYGAPIIVAHLGGNAQRTCRAVKGLENVYVDISSGREEASQSYAWGADRIRLAVNELGADNVLFGSDFPLIDPAIALGMIEDAEISDTDRDKIMFLNAQRLLGL